MSAKAAGCGHTRDSADVQGVAVELKVLELEVEKLGSRVHSLKARASPSSSGQSAGCDFMVQKHLQERPSVQAEVKS